MNTRELISLLQVLDGNGKDVKTGYEKYLNKNIFIRTVTHHYTGNVIEITPMTLTIKDAAWIADDGRFNEAMKDSSNFREVEPYVNDVTINLYSILDMTVIDKIITEVVE